MKITDSPCVCGHEKGWHRLSIQYCYAGQALDGGNFNYGKIPLCKCARFKLDNLKLVEDLAKERKLI